MRILVVEDNQKLADSLIRGLTQEGYAADYLLNGEEGEKRLLMNHTDYDIVVLDINLPGKSGLEVCRSLRDKGMTVPIIMLTARDTTTDKITGLDTGADDYLVKPFSFEELLSRVRALSRRPRSALPPMLEAGNLLLNPATQEVFQDGKKLDVTLTEFRMLEFFMNKSNEVINRQQIIDHLWDFQFNPLSRVMDVHINNLRNKLKNDHGTTIETVRGIGYRLRT